MTLSILLAIALAPAPADAQQRKAYALEEYAIIGDVQKPQVTLFVSRKNVNTDASLELRESFIPRIMKSLEKKPF
jgi:hypothetical protein